MKLTNIDKIFKKDVLRKKKIPYNFGKKTAYSSILWSNSPGYIRFETLYQFLEGNNSHFSLKLQDFCKSFNY